MIEKLAIDLAKGIIVYSAIMGACAFTVYLERRVSGFIQDRLGPNRVGPFGLFQSFADVIKFFFKEDIIPKEANKVLYVIAPLISFAPGFIVFAVIPFGTTEWASASGGLAIANVGLGILFILAVSSLSAYGLAYGGWASSSKYSFLGGIRASAQIVSFEIAMGLVIISLIMSVGSINLNDIVLAQKGFSFGFIPNWFIFTQPLAFILFIITAFAETNRLPFDMPEAEPELVGGFHTEYSSMKFALFFLGEYAAMITMSAIIVTLFLGGWHFPGIEAIITPDMGPIIIGAVSITIFSAKVGFLVFFFIWMRWTLPRTRWDQLMKAGWKVFIPLALLNIFIMAIVKII